MKLLPYSHGKYTVYNGTNYHTAIEKWINESKFSVYEKEKLIIKKKSRKRNKLYCFHLEPITKKATMKVSEVSKSYKFWRRVNVFITSLFKDYNLNSYKNSIALLEAGVNTIIPIAYWTYKTSQFSYKSYFLYENVESELTVTELYNAIKSSSLENESDLINLVSDKHIDIIKSIHAAGIRHDDPHGGNILTSLKSADINKITIADIEKAKFTLIDNDRCTKTLIKIKNIKVFFDIKDLTKFNLANISHTLLLEKYLGKSYSKTWLGIFNFWKSGGFSIKNRIYHSLKVKHLYQR